MNNSPSYFQAVDEHARQDAAAPFLRFAERVASLTPEAVLQWVETAIAMDSTNLGNESGTIILEPFQKDPIVAQFEKGVQMVVVSGPEQYGKSFIWRSAMAYAMRFISGLFYIVYEEKDKAKKINDEEFHPIVQAVDFLEDQLRSGEGKYTKDSYRMRDNIVQFLGAGSDITSRAVRRAVGDEIDTWPLKYDKILSQVQNLLKRLRRAMAAGSGCLALFSSFKGGEDDSPTWHYMQETSRGVYNLRCMNCGDLTIPSTLIDGTRDPFTKEFHGGLKWESENFFVIEDSIRLECPVCKFNHLPEHSREMVHDGAYVHKNPNIWNKRGFIFGSLSSYYDVTYDKWLALSWFDIAQARLEAGHTNSYELKRTFWNSFVGLPVPKKQISEDQETSILSHCSSYKGKQFLAAVGAADTQESPFGWFWIIRGVDLNWNTYLLATGFADSKEKLQEIIGARYEGLPVSLFIIDQGGTNAEDVKALAKANRNVWQYKGASWGSTMWKQSKTDKQIRLLLCNAEKLQMMILRLIYEQDDRSNNYWFLPTRETLSEWELEAERYSEKASGGHSPDVYYYMRHIADVRPDDSSKYGDQYRNWDCGAHERRDFFDCEKMLLVILGRNEFRKKLTRIMEERERQTEDTEGNAEPKKKPKKKPKKDAGWINKARSGRGNWIK